MTDTEYRAEQIAAVAREIARLDLVKVVRCRDCEYQGKPHECWLEATEPDEFCSRGKRKEGGDGV